VSSNQVAQPKRKFVRYGVLYVKQELTHYMPPPPPGSRAYGERFWYFEEKTTLFHETSARSTLNELEPWVDFSSPSFISRFYDVGNQLNFPLNQEKMLEELNMKLKELNSEGFFIYKFVGGMIVMKKDYFMT
jgi:hypothetical protein